MKLGTYKKRHRLRRILNTTRGRLAMALAVVMLAIVGSFVVIRSKPVAAACECNLFTNPTGQTLFNEGTSLELGVKFRPNVDGQITGVRFYKQGNMGNTHTGRLWNLGSGPEITSAVSQNETASGWQTITFSSPVSVVAGTTYVASVTMPDGRYIATPNHLTSDIVNGPLTVPSSANSGGNGVFNGTGGSYPNNSTNNGTNYWVDVSFYSTEEPTVTAVSPTNSATNVEPGDTVTATFDMSMDATSFNSTTFTVNDPDQNAVAGTYSYNDTTKTASFVANEGFQANTTYTVTLEGAGSGSAVKNVADIPIASDYTWSFTTASAVNCPCSLKDRTAPVNAGAFDDLGSVELGVKVKASTNGYITALRFYKPIIATSTSHIGNIWNASGTKLATVTFTNESDYGWQEAKLSSPLRVYENQVYIISYGSTEAVYMASANALTGQNFASGYLTAYADQSSENTATGSTTRNGVFTTSANTYPSSGSPNGSYYWVDAVFSVTSTPATPLSVGVTQPKANAYGVPRSQVVTAKFNRNLNAATVTNSTFQLFDSSNAQVAGTASYDAAKGEAVFTPTSQLTYGQRYTAKLAASVADNNGTTLGSEQTWSFTVGSAVTTDPDAAPGGPVLVVTNSGPTSKYYTEIMRTEGLNYYDAKDISQLSSSLLANYKVVVLAETALSQAQADTLSAWVTAGGNLIAMRPDAKLAGLLGLTSAGSTRANQYLLIDTASGPGQGLVSETIQFKGTADNYTLNGATALATFYSNASTSAGNPAVTSKSVGSNGGTAVAFTYDLAKSVIMMHQGNQSWTGQNRDSNAPARSNDLFYGNASGDPQPDWVDMTKFHIPQADEQQRLLANIIIDAAKDKQPMPRFWYLPGDHKAALVMAGDDHGLNNNTGTEMILNNFLNNSQTNCSVMDWECERTSHYVYANAALTNARATQYVGYKFEVGDHISSTCSNFVSYATLSAEYTSDLNTWRAKYTTVPNQKTHRYHCYVWSDWDSQARVEILNGIRYDLNYVAFPASWVGTRSPIMTGSAMNMRFTDTSGAMLDVRQGVTNLDDQTTTATNINGLLDNAIGAAGYYGIYGTHYDMSNSFDKTLIASARARNVPMVSSEQVLTWLDGRNSSTFSNFTGSAGQFGFTVAAAEGATGLRAMLPINDAGGTLQTLTSGGSNVAYQTQSVKGVSYAVFNALPGDYTATYSDYDPNGGGNGGDNGGGSDGSGSGSGGTGTTTRRSVATQGGTEQPVTPGAEQPVTDPQEETEEPIVDPSTGLPEEQEGTNNTTPSDTFWTWLWGGIGIVIVLFGLWWFFVWRRRHANGNQY